MLVSYLNKNSLLNSIYDLYKQCLRVFFTFHACFCYYRQYSWPSKQYWRVIFTFQTHPCSGPANGYFHFSDQFSLTMCKKVTCRLTKMTSQTLRLKSVYQRTTSQFALGCALVEVFLLIGCISGELYIS